jgi:DNA-binding NarL/FixJ family response regulator
MDNAPVSVLVVEDEPVFREGIKAILEKTDDLRLVGEADSARAAFAQLGKRPDVVVLDLLLPGIDGISATREIKQRAEGTRVLILSGSRSARDVREAFAAGATGYVVKTDPLEILLEGIRRVGLGQRYVSPGLDGGVDRLARAKEGAPSDDVLVSLSKREREVFELIARGMTNAQIARELCVSPKTVDTHRQRIYEKLGCHSTAEVVRFAALNGLLRDDRRFGGHHGHGPVTPAEPEELGKIMH